MTVWAGITTPDDATPTGPRWSELNPYDKVFRDVGLSPRQRSDFAGICDRGPEQIVVCFQSYDTNMTPIDAAQRCKGCPHCVAGKAYYDPYLPAASIWDAQAIADTLDIQWDDPGAFVYAVTDGEYIKIGKTLNPNDRLSSLQTGNARTLRLLYLIPVKDESVALAVERRMHTMYRDYRLEGEWFDINKRMNHRSFQTLFPADSYRVGVI